MCGVLYVESSSPIPIEQHQRALDILQSRGPDFTVYRHEGNRFIAQTVLHITGTADFYTRSSDDFLSYNGEIYNYKWHGNYSNDIELLYHTVRGDHKRFRYFEGPWAWAYTDFNTVMYASDPQGEHFLYRYQDQDIVIVCSEVAPILEYIDAVLVDVPYLNKGWGMQESTPWQGIHRLEPGRLYHNHAPSDVLDSIWDWIQPKRYKDINDAYQEFDLVWAQAMQQIKPNCAASISYSAGLDSNLILGELMHAELIAINMVNKDPVVVRAKEFLTRDQYSQLKEITVGFEDYAREYQDLLTRTCMPAQSWSFVGKWLSAKNCNTRIMFTGLAADELFGGYAVYQTLPYATQHSVSPYSQYCDPALWQRCLDVYDQDPKQATLLADYWSQVVGVDSPGLDRIGGAHGIETRNPFMLKSIMSLALSLPWEFKVGTHSKPLIRNKFLQRWPEELVLPKMGFAGHANDSLPWLGVTIDSTGDRHRDWIQIARQTFYKHSWA